MIKLQKNRSLSKLSNFDIGGKAKFFTEIKNDKELLEAVNLSKKLKIIYQIIGGGSNVVFPDEFLNRLIIKINNKDFKIIRNKAIIDAGAPLFLSIKKMINAGLGGLETLSGIPGTIGGAIVGNAGAYGHSISEVIEKAQIYNGKKVLWLKNKDCDFRYRESIFKRRRDFVILKVVFNLKKGDKKELQKTSKEIVIERLKKYPTGLKCAGSFFKNLVVKEIKPEILKLIDKNKIIEEKVPTGYLLEEVGAKGMKIGDIAVADYHANLLVNRGNGKASDIKKLAKILKEKVEKRFGIILEEEVRYL